MVVLFIGFISQGIYFICNQQYDNGSKNGVVLISNSFSQEYIWNRTWGGVNHDFGYGLATDSSNNVYVAGGTMNFGTGGSMVLVKYDNMGVQQWYRIWGGSGGESGSYVAVDSNDNVYVSGGTTSFAVGSSDLFLVKYSSSGVEQWYRTWGGSEIDGALGVAIDSYDNIYITGYTESFGSGMYDIFVVKYDSDGTQLWDEVWGKGGPDVGSSVAIDSSNNVYIGGATQVGGGNKDMVIVKYNSNGVELWNHTWGGSHYDEGYKLTVDSEDNVYLAGYSSSFGQGGADMVILKCNSIGVKLWNHTWGGNMDEYGCGVVIDSVDDVYLAGYSWGFGAGSCDMAVVKYNSFGAQQSNKTWGAASADYNTDIAIDNNDNIYLAGYTYSFGEGMEDMVLVKFALDFSNPEINIISPSQGDKIGDIAPNYEISILEPNLKSLWYTIDGGNTNYTITQLSGTINQTAWDIAEYGNILIRFYANDLLGHFGYNEVIVEKSKEQTSKIPSELIIIVLTIGGGGVVIGISIILLMRKRRKTT